MLEINNNDIEKPRVVDCVEMSERLAEELFKSPLKAKLKIISIDLCFGSSGDYTDNKFSIKVDGLIQNEDLEDSKVLKEKFVIIAMDLMGNKKIAEELIQFFWEVKLYNNNKEKINENKEVDTSNKKKFEIGAKFNTIEGSFNQYGNKNKIEHEMGRVMLIDIWATWCGYCVKPMEENITIFKELNCKEEESKIDIIAISADKDNVHKTWVDYIKTKKWGELQHYRNKSIMETVEIKSIPHIIIVDINSKIYYSGHPSGIKNLKETLKNLAKGMTEPEKEKLTIEKQLMTKEDPNPQWGFNPKSDREEIVNTINDIILNKGIHTAKFVVSTKFMFHDGKKISYTQPIFSGYVSVGEYETMQEVGIMVTEDFGLKDVQYNLKIR